MSGALLFTLVSCDWQKRGDEEITYTDVYNNAIWQAAYERLTDEFECSTGYNALREACSTLVGDEYDSKGKKRSGVRIAKVAKEAFNSYIDKYTLTLTDTSTIEFALISEASTDENVSAYDIFAEHNPSTTLDEVDFVEKMATADLYVTLIIDTNGGDYGGDTEYTCTVGTIYTLKEPTRGDDAFLGWYISADDGEERISEDTLSVDYDCTVYAKWEEYDYTAVDYSEWDSLSGATIPYFSDYYTESFRSEFAQFISDVNAKRGTLTQAAVDSYCQQYQQKLDNGDFVQSDISRVYITANEITAEAYSAASVIVVGAEGDSYAGFADYESKIKIRGNSTAQLNKKPYNFKLGSKRSVLGMVTAKKWSLLANAMDKTLMRNAIALSLAKEMNFGYVSDYRVVEVFVNGENKGCYMLVESIDVGKQKVDIDYDSGDALLQLDGELQRHDSDVAYFYTGTYQLCLGIEHCDESTVEQIKATNEKINAVETAIETGDQTKISAVLDVTSFVDYYILLEYCKDVDANISSKWFYLKDGVLYAGPPWDFDLSMGNPSSYYIAYYTENSYNGSKSLYATKFTWFSQLLECSWFKALVTSRLTALKSTIVSYYKGDGNFIDAFCSEYQGAITRNYTSMYAGGAGWSVNTAETKYDRTPNSTYEANVSYLKTWLNDRLNWLVDYYGA